MAVDDAPRRRPTILITGAAGNLGSLLARHLIPGGHPLRLMYHRKPLPDWGMRGGDRTY